MNTTDKLKELTEDYIDYIMDIDIFNLSPNELRILKEKAFKIKRFNELVKQLENL